MKILIALVVGGANTPVLMIHSMLKDSSMTSKKFPLLILVTLLLALASGCTAQRGEKSYTNFGGGLYERQLRTYEEVPPYSVALRRGSVDPGAEYSGNKTSVLWGLFTYYDY